MKTVKLTSAITTLSLVLFLSLASIANSSISSTAGLHKSGTKSLSVSTASEKDFSYLRFDVNKFINEKEEAEAINNSLDYLRFDVNDFVSESDAEIAELPVSVSFEYLRFDVNNFAGKTMDANIELPVAEYNYLRFDAANYISLNNEIYELPVTE